MTTSPRHETVAVQLVVVVSGLMIAFQVAGRATRDALFLSHFAVTSLPRMVAVAAAISLVAALVMSRVLSRYGPSRLVPTLLMASAVLQLGEWGLLAVAPRVATVLVFIQFNAFGALLVSAFWSLANERFDPRTGKKIFNWIGAAGTVGGITGGLLAERAGALLSVSAMLPVLATIHFVSAVLVLKVRQPADAGPSRAAAPKPKEAAAPLRALVGSKYLQLLAAAVLLGTVSEGLLDYVFKAAAKDAVGHGDDLLRFFALFYTGVNLVGGTAGAFLGRFALDRLGLARTVGMLPWSVAVGSVGAIAFPGLGTVIAARAGEASVRMSLYRSGWELLFTPLPPGEKRAAKPLLDVGAVRVGDVLAAACVQGALLLLTPHGVAQVLLGLAVAVSVVGILLTLRIHAGYVTALERSLISRASGLDLGPALRDRTTRMTIMNRASLPVELLGADDEVAAPEAPVALPAIPAVARLLEMHVPDVARVRRALAAGPLEAEQVPRAIALLGWDDVGREALDALSAVAARHTGQLVDALLDPRTDFAVRRRIPMAIARARSERALDGLLAGLYDQRFEVRVRCGRALARLTADAPQLRADRGKVLAAVLNEVAVGREVWESQRVTGDDGDDPMAIGAALRERTSRSLEHVFTVLALILPREPLQIAFRGLHAEDRHMRGTALEYLETSLPPDVREKLWPFIGDRPPTGRPARAREDVVADLIAQRSSIVVKLEDLGLEKKDPKA